MTFIGAVPWIPLLMKKLSRARSKATPTLLYDPFSPSFSFPNFTEYYFQWGRVCKEQGKNAKAVAGLEKCIELSQDPELT